jgi:hypothetical protein
VLSPDSDEPPDAEHAPRFPLVLKPLPHRDREWYRLVSPGKAIRVDSADELSSLWPRLRATSLRFLAQELVVGPEARVESYHVYVDGLGRIAGEFTGRKVRTFPLEFGRSTALTPAACRPNGSARWRGRASAGPRVSYAPEPRASSAGSPGRRAAAGCSSHTDRSTIRQHT